MSTIIIITPVNQNKRSESYINYSFEKNNSPDSIYWNDTKANKATINSYFGFCFNTNDIIDIYKINNIISYDNINTIRPHWSDKNRQILVLSTKITTISFTKFKHIHGYNNKFFIRGSTRFSFDINRLNKMLITDNSSNNAVSINDSSNIAVSINDSSNIAVSTNDSSNNAVSINDSSNNAISTDDSNNNANCNLNEMD